MSLNSSLMISRQALHLDRMVGDLLDVSRIESGHLELNAEVVALSETRERCSHAPPFAIADPCFHNLSILT